MWLLPWNPNSDFNSQFEIGEQVNSCCSKPDQSIWTKHLVKAKKRTTNEQVTIFRLDSKEPNNPPLETFERAKHSLKRIKTLRHPSILKYVDSCENEKSVCIVTEAVIPLADYLEKAADNFTSTQREFSIAYGLLNIAKGLQFMNNDCQLNHNNINIHSIFVNSSGVWKIGGLDYVCPLDDTPPTRSEELNEKYTPPERLDPTKARHPGAKFAVDSWGMGCLVWESFNKPLNSSSSVKTIGKMPKPLSVHYNKLVQSSPRHRVSPMDFIKSCKEANVFFNTPLLETILFLDEIQLVKEPNEKAKFFNRLENELNSFPDDICKNKILPDLINAFEYGEAGSAILNPIFSIGKVLNEEEYQNKLVPCIIKLYASKDRATRCKLLQQLDSYINLLAANVINDQIFPQIIQGFLDTNLTVREQTIKSMLHLAPKLSHTNLNEELVKHLSRLQARDVEGGIRANTTICLGKIAKHLSHQIQHSVLLPGLMRTLRDPFPLARKAAIAALSANESLFSTQDCATKIMPALCHMCIDPDPNARSYASKSLRFFIDRVQSEGDTKDSNSDVTVTPTTATAMSNNNNSISTSTSSSSSSTSTFKSELKSLSLKD